MRLFYNKEKIQRIQLSKAFDHDCSFKDKDKRAATTVVDKKLRNLRHYYGQIYEKEIFAFLNIATIYGHMKNLCNHT